MTPGTRLRLIEGMRELAPAYDGFILDLWGVVHDGVAPFPGVLDCMGRLVEDGKRIVLLSNAPRRADDVIRRIEKIGVPRSLYHAVMSSGEEAWRHLKNRDEPFYAALGRRCLHICSERDLEMREGLDLDWVATPEVQAFVDSVPLSERADHAIPSQLTTMEQIADAVWALATDDSLAGRVMVWFSNDDAPKLIPFGDRGYVALDEV